MYKVEIMFKSLFAKLTIALLLMFCLLGLLFVTVTLFSTNMYQQEVMQKLNKDVAKHIVDDTEIMRDGKINHQALKNVFNKLMVFNPSLEIYLLDDEGDILAYSAAPWKVVRQEIDLGPVKKYLNEESAFPVTGGDPRDYEKSKIFSAAAVSYPGQFEGFLYVILGGEDYDDIVSRVQGSYILKLSLMIIFVGLIFSSLAGVALLAGNIRRLNKLSTAMQKFKQQGKVDVNPVFNCRKEGDEIDHLAATFQEMAEKINNQLDNLHTTDHLRRELVANVSHDLRTPLATLQGYIETLSIKNDTLGAEQRQQYLQTAIKHCYRLNKLVAELFELAKLDAKETRAVKEPFNLAELIQDVTQKFFLAAKEKNIIILTHTDLSPEFVYADISLIERVIENLLENSLRHTAENGEVAINLQLIDSQIQVTVSDNGCGIPETEIPYIFDRFYQLDKTRNNQDSNSGLGLAIVKRIIELHQSVIKVVSVPDTMTTFKFTLPIAS